MEYEVVSFTELDPYTSVAQLKETSVERRWLLFTVVKERVRFYDRIRTEWFTGNTHVTDLKIRSILMNRALQEKFNNKLNEFLTL